MTTVYPVLGGALDLWFVRLSGHGLGNCFYSYFHAVVLAEQAGARVVTPPWLSIKVGPMLRGTGGRRFYWRMFKPGSGEIHGLRKLLTLARAFRRRAAVEIGGAAPPALVRGTLNLVANRNFTFQGLAAHRDAIRRRLLAIVNDRVPPGHCWGGGGYIAVHVRRGEFAEVGDPRLLSSARDNVRIPLAWYVARVRELRARHPEKPVFVFSDGAPGELGALLDLGAQLYRSGSDITDLLAMSAASILVGSISTYSRWAAFLGDMPSIWLQRTIAEEKPTAPDTPILYVAIDAAAPDPWPQCG